MPRFLIDVNLPYRFALWSQDDCLLMRDVGETWTDTQIWEYAKEQDLIIVSKDACGGRPIMASLSSLEKTRPRRRSNSVPTAE